MLVEILSEGAISLGKIADSINLRLLADQPSSKVLEYPHGSLAGAPTHTALLVIEATSVESAIGA